ncbi:MAG: hypothetical protein KatS3mg038_1049 [Candidatus Kapaibacterium sp.]|nr:MAG: hypothetical protein KatS3mg038_1049 [Candidatus Kapabacteria bacterium]
MRALDHLFAMLRNTFGSLNYSSIFAFAYIALGVALANAPEKGAGRIIAEAGISPVGYGIVLALAGAAQLRWPQAPRLLLTIPMLGLCAAILRYLESITDAPLAISIIVITFWLLSQRAAMDNQYTAR